MGCDIHCYVEYKPKGYDGWFSFGGRINPGRDYNIFGYLAGVRSGQDPVYPLRGYPKDAGFYASGDNFIYITDNTENVGECHISSEKAKYWVDKEMSYYRYSHDGTPRWVSNPDWHSHSWLTANEFSDVLQRAGVEGIEYKALDAAMEKLSEVGECRVVFWFDN